MSRVKYQPDSRGQLELEGIDTPLGEKADAFIAATIKAKKAIEARDAVMEELAAEMKAVNIRTIKYKGDQLRYQPGHTTREKIKFVSND